MSVVNEQTLLEELQQVPWERWGEVLCLIRTLQAAKPVSDDSAHVQSGADLATSDLIGIWADRTDITDSREFARRLRQRAEHRHT
ncbi:MAG: hypothetical protein L0Y72_24295 [Gemmataceae bacterium]|nr:hypothetical protein [Gemmataceae bacterium]MCI0742167.1 hypothetical protein [Gemmataceae bacterium]